MKVNERSSNTVISTGVMRPFWSAVCALNALQNSMMFTPCWPSAGPTGGAGVAEPPGHCNLIWAVTVRAIVVYPFAADCPSMLDLVILEVHFHRPAEDRHLGHDLRRVRVDRLDRRVHPVERPVDHP